MCNHKICVAAFSEIEQIFYKNQILKTKTQKNKFWKIQWFFKIAKKIKIKTVKRVFMQEFLK